MPIESFASTCGKFSSQLWPPILRTRPFVGVSHFWSHIIGGNSRRSRKLDLEFFKRTESVQNMLGCPDEKTRIHSSRVTSIFNVFIHNVQLQCNAKFTKQNCLGIFETNYYKNVGAWRLLPEVFHVVFGPLRPCKRFDRLVFAHVFVICIHMFFAINFEPFLNQRPEMKIYENHVGSQLKIATAGALILIALGFRQDGTAENIPHNTC